MHIPDAEEQAFIDQYAKDVQAGKFPVQCLVADAVIIYNKQILMVNRANYPQRGFYALPGGFINQNERIFDACLREAFEETNIKLNTHWLKSQRVYDRPDRAPGIRIVSHAFLFMIPYEVHIEAKAGDDASEVFWMALDYFYNHYTKNPFKDHAEIILDFLSEIK